LLWIKDGRAGGGYDPRMATPAQLPRRVEGATTTVSAYLERCPEGARVFLAHRMACVGCSLAKFDTLADAARAYGLPLDAFLHELADLPKAGLQHGRSR
jgi:hybrid cluster-associated redox disulfide protein